MKMLFSAWITLLICTSTYAQPSITPKFKSFELKEFTTLEVYIMPYTATQLIFPFMLDNPELTPTINISLSNTTGFSVTGMDKGGRNIDEVISGQNTITITGKVPTTSSSQDGQAPDFIGNLFITIGGYHISISLRSTNDIRKLVSNIVFELSPEDNEHLVEKLAKRRIADLENQYQEKIELYGTGKRGTSLQTIAELYDKDISKDRIKERLKMSISGTDINFDLDHYATVADQYGVLSFAIKNNGSHLLSIKNIEFYGIDDKVEALIAGEFNCPEHIDPEQRVNCTMAMNHLNFMDYERIKVYLTSSEGEGVAIW